MHGRDGSRTMNDLKARLGIGRKPPSEDPAQGAPPAPETGGPRAEPTQEELAALVTAIVMTALEQYRPWIKAAETAVPEIMAFVTEALEAVRRAVLDLEGSTSKYNIELMRQRAEIRKRQYDLYLEAGFSKEEALQLLVAGFAKDSTLAEKIVQSIGDGAAKAVEKRLKTT